jgi:bifunctional non-homologous end joining protein LigD
MNRKLTTYKGKRTFGNTPEPADSEASKSKRLYVIQKHDASHLHYDFRLEHNGVLLSWAVPKGPSLDPRIKRLAVHVEDHPVSYGSFAGVIPEGNYGAGTVEIWDTGSWSPIGDVDDMMQEGALKFEIFGERLHGKWALIRLKNDDKNWLLIKEKDERWDQRSGSKRGDKLLLSTIDKNQFKPQLATRVSNSPPGDEWLHEIKYDGYRILAWRQAGKVELISRNGLDWTAKFPEIAKAVEDYVPDNTTIDGEVVVMSDDGVSNFGALQKWLKDGKGGDPQYICFDLVVDSGNDITNMPLSYRKQKLEGLLTELPKAATYWIQYSNHIIGHGKSMTKEACKKGLEGVVSKKVDSKYLQGRSSSWLKSKCYQQDEYIIGGYTEPSGSRIGFGALLLGQFDTNGKLIYAGKIGSGFTDTSLTELKTKMDQLKSPQSPFNESEKVPDAKVWTKPTLIAQVRYAERTSSGSVRHGVFLGLREDKSPKEITGETSMLELPITITHPDRILFPLVGVTKFDLAEYYFRMSERILPYIQNRPVSIVRCPEGVENPCFFQKHRGPGMPESLERKTSGEKEPLITAPTAKDILSLVQFGAIELHVWGSTFEQLEYPDVMVFDLDPGPHVTWDKTIESAEVLREFLKSLNLKSFAKISGGKGIHVVVPIAPGTVGWKEFKDLAHAISTSLDEMVPGQFVTVSSKEKRDKKIFIDYLRNGRGSTSVAPYTVRANEDATVAIPISWESLRDVKSPRQFGIRNIKEWLVPQSQDPWKNFFTSANIVDPGIWAKLGIDAHAG